MTTIDETLDAMQATCDAATDGPWEFVGELSPDGLPLITPVPDADGICQEDLLVLVFHGDNAEMYSTADFVAASRTDVPRLIAAVRFMLKTYHSWYCDMDECAEVEDAKTMVAAILAGEADG